MTVLLLLVGFMLAAVVLVGVGERLRLPWPALMVVLGIAVAFTPGLPDTFALDPDLILPLFLPPLLFATAQRTSWALFRARLRTIGFLVGSRRSRSPCRCRRRRTPARPSRPAPRSSSSRRRSWSRRCCCGPSRLPTLVRVLGVAEDADAEHAAERVVAQRARQAALDRLADAERTADLPEEAATALHERMARLGGLLRGEPAAESDRDRLAALRRGRAISQRIQAEVLAARRTPGIDPEAADRVLRRLDLRTVLLD